MHLLNLNELSISILNNIIKQDLMFTNKRELINLIENNYDKNIIKDAICNHDNIIKK